MNAKRVLTAGLCALVLLFGVWVAIADAQVPGAIFTTDVGCVGVDLNIYPTKDAVYIDGGPTKKGLGTGLRDGKYYVQVTEPDGTLLGYTPTGAPVVEVIVNLDGDGEFAKCYQLSDILVSANTGLKGYDPTLNPGGEYKVWITHEEHFLSNGGFHPRYSKTDNFKVIREGEGGEGEVCGESC
jgi:hypothetical protein